MATLLLLAGAGFVIAFVWLLLRSSWGRDDVAESEAIVALSMVSATIPAWAGWQMSRLVLDAATTGQRWAGLAVVQDEGRARIWRAARFLLHPLSLPLWGWLTLGALLAEAPWLPLALLLLLGAVTLGGVISSGIVIARPGARALHDRIAHTRLVARESDAA